MIRATGRIPDLPNRPAQFADSNKHFWLFSDTEQRDAYLDEIQAKNLPLFVSDDWNIASPIDLEPAQQDIGGAINES